MDGPQPALALPPAGRGRRRGARRRAHGLRERDLGEMELREHRLAAQAMHDRQPDAPTTSAVSRNAAAIGKRDRAKLRPSPEAEVTGADPQGHGQDRDGRPATDPRESGALLRVLAPRRLHAGRANGAMPARSARHASPAIPVNNATHGQDLKTRGEPAVLADRTNPGRSVTSPSRALRGAARRRAASGRLETRPPCRGGGASPGPRSASFVPTRSSRRPPSAVTTARLAVGRRSGQPRPGRVVSQTRPPRPARRSRRGLRGRAGRWPVPCLAPRTAAKRSQQHAFVLPYGRRPARQRSRGTSPET